MKQARREDIHTLESKFFMSSQSTFLNYIFHKLLSNKEILVVLRLLLYKVKKKNLIGINLFKNV